MFDGSVGFDPMLEQKEDKKENPYKESDIEFANDLINVLFDILSGALQQVCFPFIRSFITCPHWPRQFIAWTGLQRPSCHLW